MQNRYYFQHESAYQSIRGRGEVGWQKKNLEEFRDSHSESIIRPLILKHFSTRTGKSALDLGCGSGPTAHMLADLGFDVTGIDISPTAIEMANELSAKLQKSIEFRCADILQLESEGKKFDLIYDSHCFHCIVLNEDRTAAFKAARNCLKPGGLFILDTMAY